MTRMGEKEQKIIKAVADALPKMSERDQGYFLGYAEALVSQKERVKQNTEPEELLENGR